MILELITPEAKIFSGEIESLKLPGLDGSFQILKNHAPIISALNKGEVVFEKTSIYEEDDEINSKLQVANNKKTVSFVINGGVVEMQHNKIILLAE